MNIPQNQSLDPLTSNQTPSLVGSSPPPPPLPLAPSFMQNVSKMTNVVGKGIHSFASGTKNVTGKTFTCVLEYLDFSSGTKDPSASILNSCKRLKSHDTELQHFFEFLADKAESYHCDNPGILQEMIKELIKENSFKLIGDSVSKVAVDITGWALETGKEMVGKIIKANILHIAANWADSSFDPCHDFVDGKNNPIGRLLSVLIKCFTDFQGHLDQILLLPDHERPQAYQKLFQELSERLLNTCFPSGVDDIQLFSTRFPVMKVIKEHIWDGISKELPPLLEKLYHQTRPLSEQCPDWKEQFDEEAWGLEADQLVNLPSVLIQHFIRDNRACLLDDLLPLLENFLQQKGCQPLEAAYLSQLIVKYGKDLTLSDDPALLACGAFVERYFMERILCNLSNFVPGNVDEPLPTHMLSKWTQGNVFKALLSTLSGEKLDPLEKIAAVRELLAPFGFDQKVTFPLPEIILSKKWPDIEKFIDEKLPGIIFDKIPHWSALGSKESNKRKIILWLDDSSIVKTISNLSGMAVDRGVGLLAKSQQSMAELLNNQLLSPVLSKDSQDKLDEQLKELLDDDPSNNNQTLRILKGFGSNCIEAFALQVFEKMYENYDGSLVSENLAELFETEDDNVESLDPSGEVFGENILKEDLFEDLVLPPGTAAGRSSLSFAAWLSAELTKACRKLTAGDGSGDDLKDLELAIHLKNAIRLGKDPLLVNKAQDELNILWPKIQPKFNALLRDLFGIMGCGGAASLPLPQNFQPLIWKMLNDSIPGILFNQAGDLLLPLLEKQNIKTQIGMLPNGDLICRGCEELARDIVKHIPEWVEGEIDILGQKVQTFCPEVDLSTKAQKEMEEALRSILKGDDTAYKDVWGDLQAYVEGLLLKAAQAAGNINGCDLAKIQDLIQTTWEALKGGSDPSVSPKTIDAKEILIDFTDKFLAVLGIEAAASLFGIPQALQGPLLSVMKEKMASHLLKLYDWEGKIRSWTIRPNPLENILPVSLITKAISSEIFYQLENGTDKLAKSGNSIPIIYSVLSDNLTDLAKKDYKIAGIFQEVIAKAIPTSPLCVLFDRLNDPSVDGEKLEIADWMTPLLTDKIIGCLTSIMDKEKRGSRV